jgi:hypothetical protein
MAWELEHLVKKQDAVVSQTYLARSRDRTSTNESGARDRMMRSSKWPDSLTHATALEHTGDRMNSDYFKRFFFRELG